MWDMKIIIYLKAAGRRDCCWLSALNTAIAAARHFCVDLLFKALLTVKAITEGKPLMDK